MLKLYNTLVITISKRKNISYSHIVTQYDRLHASITITIATFWQTRHYHAPSHSGKTIFFLFSNNKQVINVTHKLEQLLLQLCTVPALPGVHIT